MYFSSVVGWLLWQFPGLSQDLVSKIFWCEQDWSSIQPVVRRGPGRREDITTKQIDQPNHNNYKFKVKLCVV